MITLELGCRSRADSGNTYYTGYLCIQSDEAIDVIAEIDITYAINGVEDVMTTTRRADEISDVRFDWTAPGEITMLNCNVRVYTANSDDENVIRVGLEI